MKQRVRGFFYRLWVALGIKLFKFFDVDEFASEEQQVIAITFAYDKRYTAMTRLISKNATGELVLNLSDQQLEWCAKEWRRIKKEQKQ